MTQQIFNSAIELFDAANNEDLNIESSDGKDWSKERLYSHRMSDMLQRYLPDSDDAVKLAVHAQHIQRWKSPRSDFSMDRKGYHQWRIALYTFHADTAGKYLEQAGYDEAFIDRVKLAIGKKSLQTNTDTQILEDVAALVFIEHYMQAFVDKHPEYDEEKWLLIVIRTLKKMTTNAHQFALEGHITLPEPLVPLIQKAVASL
jgi:hypothetical protein